jgi:RNA polymerase sigma-70 factor (ECF subfamily)
MVMRQQIDIIGLVTRAQGGDRQAYSELYECFQPRVYAVALACLRDAPAAQELTHDVLVQAFEKLSQLRQPAAFPGWLRQMAMHMAINRGSRSGQRAYATDVVLDEMTAPSASPLEQLISHEQIAQVRQSLARLKPLDRDTLLAFYYDGQSLATISQQAAAPVGTIKRRLHVARQRLRQELAWVLRTADSPASMAGVSSPTQ